jgi:NAD(P)-dependent dehydrogenase (short-subunit alcohol dehydrogenase family)
VPLQHADWRLMGFNVAVLSSSGKGEALAQELGGIGVTGSNESNDDLKRLVDQAMERWSQIDGLINSAGPGPRAHSRDRRRAVASGHRGLLPERCPCDPADGPDHGAAESRLHHQYLDGLGL